MSKDMTWRPCAYHGTKEIPPCPNLIRGKRIFCADCMLIVPFGAFGDFIRAFEPWLPYDEAMASEKHRKAIEGIRQEMNKAKSQMSLLVFPVVSPFSHLGNTRKE